MLRLTTLTVAACLFGGAATAQGMTDGIGGAFELIDHRGVVRTEVNPEGHHQLVFFGYANCQEICSAALPLMASATELVEASGGELTPVMITVDPERDTVAAIGPALQQFHPEFVGLTGSAEALQVAYDAYEVEFEELFVDPFYGTVFAHGSFIYLLDGQGEVLTLLPPVLGPEMMADIIGGYLETS